jgi:hypothetical protein
MSNLPNLVSFLFEFMLSIELSVKSSKESTEPASLLKTGNKVVEVGWVYSKVEDEEGTIMGSKLGTST